MPSYRPPKIASSEITPRQIYVRRREFLGGDGVPQLGIDDQPIERLTRLDAGVLLLDCFENEGLGVFDRTRTGHHRDFHPGNGPPLGE